MPSSQNYDGKPESTSSVLRTPATDIPDPWVQEHRVSVPSEWANDAARRINTRYGNNDEEDIRTDAVMIQESFDRAERNHGRIPRPPSGQESS